MPIQIQGVDTSDYSYTNVAPSAAFKRNYVMIDNYIYLYHTKTFIILPVYPESVQDSMGASFASTTILSRSAPIFSYQNSGPRVVQFNLRLHREMMSQINWGRSNADIKLGDDYVDLMIREIQSAVVPRYTNTSKMVDPPMVAVRFGSDIFCKGIVTGNIGITYDLPIITDANGNDKYSLVMISFSVTETDPYDAQSVALAGSYRGLDPSLERNLWRVV